MCTLIVVLLSAVLGYALWFWYKSGMPKLW